MLLLCLKAISLRNVTLLNQFLFHLSWDIGFWREFYPEDNNHVTVLSPRFNFNPQTNYFVLFVVFKENKDSTCINIDQSTKSSKLLVHTCNFLDLNTSSQISTAINFGKNGNFKCKYVYCLNCVNTNPNSQSTLRIQTSNEISLGFSSFALNNGTDGNVWLTSDNTNLNSLNFSKNTARRYPVYWSRNLKVAKCHFFEVVENNSTVRTMYHAYGEQILQYANIIKNSFVNKNNGILHVEYNCTMILQNAIFSQNTSPNALIGSYYNTSLTLINITLDNNIVLELFEANFDSTINTDNIGNISQILILNLPDFETNIEPFAYPTCLMKPQYFRLFNLPIHVFILMYE